MAYSELVKNFDKIRAYMREFYIYGFKSREDYNFKSLRSYDNERRRIQSWLGEYMKFIRLADGKTAFLSIDSRSVSANPFFNAFKAKSFTDFDITLHFIIFDILIDQTVSYTLTELTTIIEEKYLSFFTAPISFDESTLRKKLKEYVKEGIIVEEKQGKSVAYRRANEVTINNGFNALSFYSEISPLGVIGSFILDKQNNNENYFSFKHRYMQSALDSNVLCSILLAMQSKSVITVTNLSVKSKKESVIKLIPLKIRISVQGGRQYLLAYSLEVGAIKSFRIDYLSNVKIIETSPDFDKLRSVLADMEDKIWGVNVNGGLGKAERLERVEFTIKVEKGEDYIVNRLYRERRIGTVEKVDDNTYRFKAEVYDTSELIPWIRTFICRIEKLNFSNRTIENKFKKDVEKLYEIYGLTGGETNGI